MKEMLIVIAVLLVFLSGCASVKITKTTPDGTKWTAEYIRWFNQKMDGVVLNSPDGWILELEGQKSDTEIAFGLGAASVEIGGDND